MFGYTPRPGDPFIFSIRNFPTCTELTDVVRVLGTLVSGPATRSIGVLGVGQVDRLGNLNSTWSPDGGYIVGSGGANDIATAADEILVTVKHDVERLVEEVTYITCPGSNISTIVTTEGVLKRIDNEFVLVAYFERGCETTENAVRRIRSATGWDLLVHDSLERIPAPSESDLATLRSSILGERSLGEAWLCDRCAQGYVMVGHAFPFDALVWLRTRTVMEHPDDAAIPSGGSGRGRPSRCGSSSDSRLPRHPVGKASSNAAWS